MSLALLGLAVRTLAGALLAAGTSYALGRRLLSRCDLHHSIERLALRTVSGLAALGAALTALALVGWLRPVPVALVALAAHVAGWRARVAPDEPAAPEPRPRWRWRLALLGVALLPFLALPLYPAYHHDAGTYHLPITRSLATHHRLEFLPEIRFAAFPQLAEILSVPSFWLAGEAGVQATHFLFGALTAALLLAWGRRLLPQGVRLWPAATWLGNPLVVFLLGAAYVDLTLSCFVTFGAFAWTRWRESLNTAWLTAAGGVLGAAVAVKYLGLIPLAAFVLATAVCSGNRAASLVRFATPALITGGPMIGWIAATTGNPVFPFLPVLFGETAWSWTAHWRGAGADPSLPANLVHTLERIAAGLGEHVIGACTLPIRLLMSGSPLDAESIVSFGFLAALALGVVAVRRHRPLLAVELLVAGYGLAWSSLEWPDARLALPAAPMAAILAVVGADHLRERLSGRFRLLPSSTAFTAVATLLALPGIGYAWTLVAAGGVPPGSAKARIEWLGARAGEIAAVELLNRTHPNGYRVYGLFAENTRYFANGEQLGDWVGHYPYDLVIPLLDDPDALAAELCSMGADHLLVVTSYRPFDAASKPGFSTRFRELLRARGAVLYEITSCPPSAPKAREGSPT